MCILDNQCTEVYSVQFAIMQTYNSQPVAEIISGLYSSYILSDLKHGTKFD